MSWQQATALEQEMRSDPPHGGAGSSGHRRTGKTLLFGKLVLYLGTKILIGLELVLVFRTGDLRFNIPDLSEKRGEFPACLRDQPGFERTFLVAQECGGFCDI